jgi:hypothetical protein
MISSHPLTFQHWAGITPYTSPYGLAESCVFVKQLHGAGFCDLTRSEAFLLPKLRNQFAEFLRESYLARLGLLSLSTCVGFSTITRNNAQSFSRQRGITHVPANAGATIQ